VAFVQGDATTMQQQIEWINGKPDEYLAQSWQAETVAFLGQLRKSKEFSSRAVELAQRRNLKEAVAQIFSEDAARDALFGDCKQVKEEPAQALAVAWHQRAWRLAATAINKGARTPTPTSRRYTTTGVRRLALLYTRSRTWGSRAPQPLAATRRTHAKPIQISSHPGKTQTRTCPFSSTQRKRTKSIT